MTTVLAVDVGNTNIVVGVYDNAKLLRTWRLATVHDRTEDELAVSLDGLLAQEDLALAELDAVVVGSVVPPLTQAFARLAERYLEHPAFVIGPGIKTGVRLRVDNPAEVGADRIANTLAAHRRYGLVRTRPGPQATGEDERRPEERSDYGGTPVVVVDFGTTTNFDVVSEDGDFLGGSFAPGLEVSAEALFGRASRLFRVALTPPAAAIGKNTADCLRSGIVFGYVGLVEGLLARIIAELPAAPRVIATGGLASTIAPLAKGIETVDEDLTLEGLRLLYELNV